MKRFAYITALVIFLDQLSKWWLLFKLSLIAGVPIEVTSFFKLVMVWNRGVSFGLFNQQDVAYQALVLIGVALVISTLLVRMAYKSSSNVERISYALVVGGALGNVIDRLRFGAVADFFYFHLGDLGWPAFNIADASICIGVGLLLFGMIKTPAKP